LVSRDEEGGGGGSPVKTTTTTIRIGWLGDWKGRLPVEDGILSTCEKALEDWSRASGCSSGSTAGRGCSKIVVVASSDARTAAEKNKTNDAGGSSPRTTTIPLFDLDKLWESYNTIRFACTYEKYSQQFDVEQDLLSERGRNRIKEELAWELETGRSIGEKDLDRARVVYREYEQWLEGILTGGNEDGNETGGAAEDDGSFDVLALPSAQVWPFPVDDRYPKEIEGTRMDTYHRWMEVCVPVSFGGLPCVTIPAGFGRGKNKTSTTNNNTTTTNNNNNTNTDCERQARPPLLPIGIQLFAKRWEDLKLLQLANEYYRHRSSHKAT